MISPAHRTASPTARGAPGVPTRVRGEVYWYKFMWQGRSVRESTKQGNDKVARQMGRTPYVFGKGRGRDSGKEEGADTSGFRRQAIPSLGPISFCGKAKDLALLSQRSAASEGLRSARVRFNGRSEARRKSLRLRGDSSGKGSSNCQHQPRAAGTAEATALGGGVGFVEQVPKIRMLSGERHREFVLSPEEESRYLAAARVPLVSVATMLADTGMRPEECYRRRWEHVTWVNGRYGTLLVTHGKTAAAADCCQ